MFFGVQIGCAIEAAPYIVRIAAHSTTAPLNPGFPATPSSRE